MKKIKTLMLLLSFCLSVESSIVNAAEVSEFKPGVYTGGESILNGESIIDKDLNISIVVKKAYADEFCRFYGKCSVENNSLSCISKSFKKFPLIIDIKGENEIEIRDRIKNNQIVKNVSCDSNVSFFGTYHRDPSRKVELAPSGIIYETNRSQHPNLEVNNQNTAGSVEEKNDSYKISSATPSNKTADSKKISQLLKECRNGNDEACDSVAAILDKSLSK